MKRFVLAIAVSAIALISSMSIAPVLAQTPEECLAKVKALEPMLPNMIEGAKTTIKSLIPDPAGYEKTLPTLDKVIEDKDTFNFKNYGGLSEAYFFSGDMDNGNRIYKKFVEKAPELLGADDTYAAFVEGDLGLLKFMNKDLSGAEECLMPSIKQLEAHLTPQTSNNLIAAYLCMAMIRDKSTKEDDKKEAETYAKKLVDLVHKQKEPLK